MIGRLREIFLSHPRMRFSEKRSQPVSWAPNAFGSRGFGVENETGTGRSSNIRRAANYTTKAEVLVLQLSLSIRGPRPTASAAWPKEHALVPLTKLARGAHSPLAADAGRPG